MQRSSRSYFLYSKCIENSKNGRDIYCRKNAPCGVRVKVAQKNLKIPTTFQLWAIQYRGMHFILRIEVLLLYFPYTIFWRPPLSSHTNLVFNLYCYSCQHTTVTKQQNLSVTIYDQNFSRKKIVPVGSKNVSRSLRSILRLLYPAQSQRATSFSPTCLPQKKSTTCACKR